MTPQEIQGFNEKAPQYRQVEALQVTWANQEPVELSLTLRPADPAIRHTRMVIRAKGVRGLRIYSDRVDIPEVGCLQIRSIAERHWEDANYEVVDIEQNDAMTFTCAHIELELRVLLSPSSIRCSWDVVAQRGLLTGGDAVTPSDRSVEYDPEENRCGHINHPTNNKLTQEGTATMKLATTTQVSVDGVMQGPGGPDEDERGVFEHGGWAHFDNEAGTVMDEIFQRADAFLFGRRTYEIFAGSWGTWDDPGDSPIWTALNKQPKYVASTTLTEPRWANTTVLSGDVAAAVRELKAKPGRELQVQGSGALTRWLLDNQLVDEITLFTFPVVVGQGTRLFPDTGPDIALDLVDSRATPKGVTIQVYRPTGRPQYATATAT